MTGVAVSSTQRLLVPLSSSRHCSVHTRLREYPVNVREIPLCILTRRVDVYSEQKRVLLKRVVLVLSLLLMISTLHLSAQVSTARALLYEPSPLMNAMGGCGSTQYGNAFDDFSNPASLAYQREWTVGGMYKSQGLSLGDQEQKMLDLNYTSNQAWGFGVSAVDYKGPRIIKTDISGTVLGTYKGGYQLVSVSSGREIAHHISVGARLSYCSYQYDESDSSSNGTRGFFTGALSMMVRNPIPVASISDSLSQTSDFVRDYPFIPEAGLTLGCSVENIGSAVSFFGEPFSQPLKVSLGANYTPLHYYSATLSVAAELESKPRDGNALDFCHLGVRCVAFRCLSLIGGATLALNSTMESYLSYGAAFDYSIVHVIVVRSFAYHADMIQAGITISWGH